MKRSNMLWTAGTCWLMFNFRDHNGPPECFGILSECLKYISQRLIISTIPHKYSAKRRKIVMVSFYV